MSIEASPDRKKQVCTTLAGIVKGSPLAAAIDPSAFFMQLNANYGVLVRGQTLDLNLLWGTMSAQHGPDTIAGLFLKFADAGQRLGFEVALPAPLAQMPPAERQARVARLEGGAGARGGSGGMPAPAGVPSSGLPSPAVPLPTRLPPPNMPTGAGLAPTPRTPLRTEIPSEVHGLAPTPAVRIPGNATPARGLPSPSTAPPRGDFTPLPQLFEEYEPTPMSEAALAGIPDEQQRRIISTLVGALKATEAGPHLSAPQLSYFLASRFHVLCDGTNFFFQAVYDAVMELQGVEEKHVYQAAVRFRRWLARVGLQLSEPQWKLDQATRDRLEEQASKVPLDTYSPIAKAMAGTSAQAAAPTTAAPDAPAGPTTAEERQDRRLRAWGLRGLTERQMMALRMSLGVLLVVIALVVRMVLDPFSSLDVASYRAVMPLSDAVLFEGKWLGTLDEQAWRALPADRRAKSLRDLGVVLNREGRLAGARIVDARTKGVIGYDLKGTMRLADKYMELGIEAPKAIPPPRSP